MTSTRFALSTGSFSQDWSNASLFMTDDNWSGVANIVGCRGDDVVLATGVDARIITGGATSPGPIDGSANQTNPNTFATGGVAEFAPAHPTIALNGSGPGDAPKLVICLDATGRQNIRFRANLRDLDGSVDCSIPQPNDQSGRWHPLCADRRGRHRRGRGGQ